MSLDLIAMKACLTTFDPLHTTHDGLDEAMIAYFRMMLGYFAHQSIAARMRYRTREFHTTSQILINLSVGTSNHP